MLATIMLQASSQGGGLSGILMIVAMIVIFYFFMIRPQSKKQKEIKKAREALTKGDKVVTAGGIHGRIKEVKGDTMNIEISSGVIIKVDTASVYPAAANPQGKSDSKEKAVKSDKISDNKEVSETKQD